MQLEQRIVGNVAIIKINGDVTLNKGGDVLLKDKIQSLLHQDYKNLLIDLSSVSYVDSAGLGELVQAYVTTKNRGGRLRRSEEHTSELQSQSNLVCRLLLEKKKKNKN